MRTTTVMNDKRIIGTIEKIIGVFRKQNFTPNEACAVLSATCAMIICNVTDSFPEARGKEEQMVEDYKRSILANMALFRGENPAQTAHEA